MAVAKEKKTVVAPEEGTVTTEVINEGVESTVTEVKVLKDHKELPDPLIKTGLIPIPCNLLVEPIRYCLAPQKVCTKVELNIPKGSVAMIFLEDELTATTNVRLCNQPLMIGTGEPQEVVVYLSNAGNDGVMMYTGAKFLKYLVLN